MSIGIIREFFDFESTHLELDTDPYNFIGGPGNQATIVTSPAPPYGTYTLRLEQDKTGSFFRSPLFTYTSGTKMLTASYVRIQEPPTGYPLGYRVPALLASLTETDAIYWNIELDTGGTLRFTDGSSVLLDSFVSQTDQWYRIEVIWEPGNASGFWAWYVAKVGSNSSLKGSGTGADFTAPTGDVKIGLYMGGQGGDLLAYPIDVYHGGGYFMENITDIDDRIGKSEGRRGDWISILDGGKSTKDTAVPDCDEIGGPVGDNLTGGIWSNIGDDNLATSGLYIRAPAASAMGGGVRLEAPFANSIDNLYANKWIWYGTVNRPDSFKAVYGKYNLSTGYDVVYETADSIGIQARYYRHIEDASAAISPDINEMYVIGMRNDAFIGRSDIRNVFLEGWCYSLHSAPLTYIPQFSDNIPLYISAGFAKNECNLFIKGFRSINNSGNLFVRGRATSEDDADLYLYGKDNINSSVDLFMYGSKSINNACDLFLSGYAAVDNDVDLYVGGYLEASGSMTLYTSGEVVVSAIPFSGNVPIYIHGQLSSNDNSDLFICGSDTASADISLYTESFDSTNASTNLFIFGGKDLWMYTLGHDVPSGNVLLFIEGKVHTNDQVDLFITGHNADTNSAPMYVRSFDSTNTSINLFIFGGKDLFLFIEGIAGVSDKQNDTPLYIEGIDNATTSGDLYIHGLIVELGQFPLYTTGLDTQQNSATLFVGGTILLSGDTPLYIEGSVIGPAVQVSGSIELYIRGHYGLVSSIDLLINGNAVSSGTTDLFLGGLLTESEQLSLYTNGLDTQQDSITLYIGGIASGSNDMPLFINGSVDTSGNTDLFLHGFIGESGQFPLYLTGLNILQNSTTLFIHGTILSSGDTPLYVDGIDLVSDEIALFISSSLYVSGNANLYINGGLSITNSTTLYILGSGIGSANDELLLFINGFEILTPVVCPVLDPTASIQISERIIDIYKNNIDALINQLGKNTTLIFEPQIVSCPNCLYDTQGKQSIGVYNIGGPRPFARGRQCPYCKGVGTLKTESEQCIKCLVQWNPKNLEDYGISIANRDDVVRLKTYIAHMDDLMRADKAIVLRDSIGITQFTTRRIISPTPVGLRYDSYCVSFWELI